MNKKKHALILGGSSDIGLETIKKLLKLNWRISAHYFKNKTKLKTLNQNNLNLIFSDFKKINNKNINKWLRKTFKEKYDVIVNLVGYVDNKSYKKSDLNSLIQSITINALIPNLIIRNNINYMLERKWGRILNCSSIGVKFGGGGNSYNYAFSKNCLEFIPNAHKEWANRNVLINNLRIGVTNTKIHKRMRRQANIKKRINLIPMKRMAQPKEIANYIINSVIDENSYMTGQTINISGGE